MGFYKYLSEVMRKEYAERATLYRERLSRWRKEDAIVRVRRPTNLVRARALGYKAKKGYIIVRVRVRKGLRKVPNPKKGRKPSKSGRFFGPVSHQLMAEQRANRKYINMEVLNSYWIGEDGQYKYFEVILIDPSRKEVGNPAKNRKGRAFRALTRAGRKVRGLLVKGKRRPKR
ncbi:MAG: 50S ribosomal protein L15e [Candidatus Asgardarchaeia archaeon]